MLAAGVETAPLLTATTIIPIAANVRDKVNFTLPSYEAAPVAFRIFDRERRG
jgi:hypothetical protein